MLTVSPSPHIKTPDTTATVMFDVILALLPAFIWGVYVFGVRALAVAGLVGQIVATNASVSGAECGCQAEVGTACSMASAALCELFEDDLTIYANGEKFKYAFSMGAVILLR